MLHVKPLMIGFLMASALWPALASAAPVPGTLIKAASSPAVYYYATDGKRYVFANEKTYVTWYSGFGSVRTVTAAELADIAIGGNVTYRPGVRLVKIQSDPRVYAVAARGNLRHIASENIAVALYGANWNTLVDDIPDAFFVNYRVGAPIEAVSDYSRDGERNAASTINHDLGLGAPPAALSNAPKVGDCQIFPSDNPWNTDISNAPVHPNSAAYVASIGAGSDLHPDFGWDEYGIPYNVVGTGQAKVPVTFDDYGDESDAGPYPIPVNAKVENGSDAHVLVVDKDACKLYELFNARKNSGGGWTASSGAIFDLTSNALRTRYWTSADAAGLPIFPGLIRYDEVVAGKINHPIRFTAQRTQRGFIEPATHYASSSTDPNLPPMGLRLRLKKNYDISGYTGQARVILEAMKTYGLILADNGGNWFFQGEQHPDWNDENIDELKGIPGSAFEAVDTGPIIK